MEFARLRQCALRLIMLSWSHSSPQPKRHLDRFSHFCTSHDRLSLYYTIGRPSKLPFPWEIWTPSNNGSLGPPSPKRKLYLDRFTRGRLNTISEYLRSLNLLPQNPTLAPEISESEHWFLVVPPCCMAATGNSGVV